MNNDSMYFTMYNEKLHQLGSQQKTIDELKVHIKDLTVEMKLYRIKMRKELLRLQKKLGERNANDWVDY